MRGTLAYDPVPLIKKTCKQKEGYLTVPGLEHDTNR